jgi:hypothetical protein
MTDSIHRTLSTPNLLAVFLVKSSIFEEEVEEEERRRRVCSRKA